MRIYHPKIFVNPSRVIDVESAWRGLETIIKPLMDDFGIKGNKALEFGVDYGYSTAILANFFEEVTGVDTFKGDVYTNTRDFFSFQGLQLTNTDIFEQAKNNLKGFQNIRLIKADYKDFIKTHNSTYDLIHVDIIHTYDPTFECGLWSARRAPVVIFHDTEAFPEVKRAVEAVANKTGKKFYNYPYHFGLGIIV